MHSYEGRTVLVTGAAGFVGPHLARALAKRGAAVHGYGIGGPATTPEITRWTEADLLDEAAIRAALAAAQPAAVIHLAGQSSAARSFEAPEETFRANVVGTWRLLEAVRDAAPTARVLIVGTSEVYGPGNIGSHTNEDAPFRPVSPYALSKAAVDQLAASFGASYGIDVVRARPFGHTGPGQTPRFVIPAWAEQIARIEKGNAEPVLKVGNLEVTRDLTDVRDIVEGYCALMERGTKGAVYNLCRGEGVKLTDVVTKLANLSKVPVKVEVDPARLRPADVPYLVGDAKRASTDCSWTARIPLETTLTEVLEEWRAKQ